MIELLLIVESLLFFLGGGLMVWLGLSLIKDGLALLGIMVFLMGALIASMGILIQV